MEELLRQLVNAARTSEEVASSTLDSGMNLFAYPHQDGVVVGLGYRPDLAHLVRAESVLRTRANDIERFGAWLPALFNDGSWYVVRQVPQLAEHGPVLSEHELMTAQELLA